MNIEDEVCSKCGNREIYIQKDGKTLRCYKCKHEWFGHWVKKGTESEGDDEQ